MHGPAGRFHAWTDSRTVVLAGGTGYLGSLIAARLLQEEDVGLLVLARRPSSVESFLQPVRAEIELNGATFDPAWARRIRLVALPAFERLPELDSIVRESGADQIIHAAGCVDYFDNEGLNAVNIGFTRALTELAKRLRMRRFIYLSTAFSSGYTDGFVEERLHQAGARRDPTEYTRSKREAEWIVARSGIPYLIIRPSIVVGDSRDGHYSGKRYGLYQLWSGMERFLFDQWRPVFPTVGPRVETHFLHQDAFQAMFLAAYRVLPGNTVFHAVSQPGPSLRDLWGLWLDCSLRPKRVEYYESVDALPIGRMERRQRSFLALASLNLEIASHRWRFETTQLDRLRQYGLIDYTPTTLATLATCQHLFIRQSKAIQVFLAANRSLFPERTEVMPAEEKVA